jgi:Arf-GAP/coiled-coil/ANK repeat/PH domain-containing protein
VQTIRQGYLSKRSSNLRGDWKRRFFVLDSRGMLYYYRKQCSKPSGSGSQLSGQRNSSELGSGLLSRWLSSNNHGHGGVHDEKSVARHTVNLLTSTIKVDADQSDLRFCFRIISPTKNYTLQAESALDQMDWIEKITGVIASLLSSQVPEQRLPGSPMGSGHHRSASESSSYESSEYDHPTTEEFVCERSFLGYNERPSRSFQPQRSIRKGEKPIDALRKVCGNDKCADCGAPEPDWASLNLGVLVCIECSGVHRNLGVHISKVRSLTLDVKVWEPSVISLFQALGNTFANTVWEELLHSRSAIHFDPGLTVSDKSRVMVTGKPSYADMISIKEKYIQAKYAEKLFVRRSRDSDFPQSAAQQMWDAVSGNDKKAVYRLIVNGDADVNYVYDQTSSSSLTLSRVILVPERPKREDVLLRLRNELLDRTGSSSNISPEGSGGSSLLHCACEKADLGMVELLLQYGANVNASDSSGQTPLHCCLLRGKVTIARLLLTRGADPEAMNREGKTALDIAAESNFTDPEVLALLSDTNGYNHRQC